MDYENVFSFLKVPYAGVYAIALLFTIVALVISTRYSVKNLLRSKNGQDTEINSKRVRVERVKGETTSREAATSQHNESESEDEVEADDDDESNGETNLSKNILYGLCCKSSVTIVTININCSTISSIHHFMT